MTQQDADRSQELTADQMGAAGDGEIRDAQMNKQGMKGETGDFASDLDAKKAEQAPAREAKMEERENKVDVAGVLGQRGGPASTTD